MKATEHLREDHGEIMLIMKILEQISNKIEILNTIDEDDLEKCIDYLKIFVDKCHEGKEETILFPELVKGGIANEKGPIGVLIQEHLLEKDYVETLSDEFRKYKKVNRSYSKLISKSIRGYIFLFSGHIQKENNVLFPMADQILNYERQERMLTEFIEFEKRKIGEDRHEELKKELKILKNKYL
ncbi:MAG: hemerythrin domain-containing protein [Bacteroidota bacterium]|nr:hemerythrin domain-containing protein [Bacteroidota bacterium]